MRASSTTVRSARAMFSIRASWSTRASSAAEHVLEQARVDLAVPPRTRLREQDCERRCLTATTPGRLDRDEPAGDQLIARLEVAAATQARTGRCDRVARKRAILAIGEARQGQRDEPLSHRKVGAREHCCDRPVAHGRLRRSYPLSRIWLGAIASTTRGARDDAQPEVEARAENRRGRGFRPARRYTARTKSWSALTAPMYGRPGGCPVFLVSGHRRAGGPLADAERVRRRGTPSGPVMQALEAFATATPIEHDAPTPRARRSAWRCSSGQRTRGGPEGPPATNRSGPRSALEIRIGGAYRLPSTFRPPVSLRPGLARHDRTLRIARIAADCRDFVAVPERS